MTFLTCYGNNLYIYKVLLKFLHLHIVHCLQGMRLVTGVWPYPTADHVPNKHSPYVSTLYTAGCLHYFIIRSLNYKHDFIYYWKLKRSL